MSQYILFFCNYHKYYVTNMKYGRMNVKCTVNRNRKKRCILRTIAQNKSKDDLSTIAKNLNTNNPRIVLENIKLIINDNNRTTEMSQDICTTNMNYINKHINTNSLSNAINFENNTVFSLDNGHGHNTVSDENDVNPMKHVDSDNAIFFDDCDNKHNKVKAVNVTVSYDNDNSHKTVDINTNNSTNDNDPDNNLIFSCSNDKDHNIVDSAINVNNSTNDTDFDNNAIFSYGNGCKTVDGDINTDNSTNDNNPDNIILFSCGNDKDHSIVDSAINANNSANGTDFDKNVIYSYDNEHGHDALTLNDENCINNSKKHADCDNAMIFSNNCDNKRSRVKAMKLNVTFFCDNDNSYKTVDSDINTNNSTCGNDPDNNISLLCDNDRDHNIVNSTINANNSTNDFDNNVIFSYDNGNGCKTVDDDINTDNSTNDNNPDNNILFSCGNDKDHSIVDSAINANNSANGTDFDKNVIYSYDNEHGHDALTLNDKNCINNPKKHADCDNAMIFSNDCNNKRSRAIKLNVTFSCDNDNSYKTVDSDINTNNSTCGNDPDNNISLFCDNDRDHNIVNSTINANNSTNDFDNNVIFSYGNSNGCKMIDGDININNSMNDNDPNNNISFSCNNDKGHSIVLDSAINANNCRNNTGFDNNVTFSCDNDNSCDTVDNYINTNNSMNSNNSYNNTISCHNNNANVSATGVVLNNVMIFPYDDDNNSSILNLTNAKTSMNDNNSDNNIIFSCDDENIINNVACANITSTSEYLPSASEITIEKETIEQESIHNNISTTNNKNSSESLIDISSVNTFGCREDNLYIQFSQPKGLQKKNFCYYCKKFQSKIARHLESVHKLEPEVKKFLLLPKGNLERKKIIETIRRKGNFIHNTDPSINTGELIVCRRPAKNSCKTLQDFTCCAKCKGWFTKNNIRHHFKQCAGVTKGRNVQILGRAVMGRIHECASETVRKVLFPVLREDDVTRCIRYDKLLITYANKLCIKYNHQHQQDMIRARLRLLGRFLIAVKEYNPNVTEFSDIYDPSIYDNCLKAVNKIAHFDDINKKYGAPSVASNIGTNLKQVGNLLITECIKTNDIKKQNTTENFLKLIQEDYGISINKTVEENMTQYKRQKKVTLPSMEDIKKLHSYLKSERKLLYAKLQNKFMYKTWLELAKVTLTSTQVFNRRRAGEIERVTIEDFHTREGITKETYLDLYKSLGTNLQQIADKYVRFLIRGKLRRTVPVILDMELVRCIELILKHRKDANVPKKNPYVFGIPNNTSNKRYFKYLRACILMRNFSKKCGARIPHLLRGTELRKHIATTCITLNLSENEVDDLTNFMGHHEKIHKRHYRQSIPAIEIIRMTKFLQAALGENVQQQSNNSDSEEEMQDTSKDVSSVESESDAETCMISSRKPPSVQSGSNLPITCITDRQQKSVKRKIMRQNHTMANKDNDCDETYSPKIKKRRSTSPFGPIKRRRWTEEERNIIIQEFQKEITTSQLPSNKKISHIKEKNKCLVNRSVAQIKTWIHNYISGKIKRH